jgi:DNA-binding transcriptional MerR regulator
MVAMHARARATAGVGTPFVRASEAARRLGVSTKALRVYEHAGLIHPRRSPAGWRLYGPRDLEEVRSIVAWRLLGVGLADIATLQGADAGARRRLLRTYQATLEARAGAVAAAAEQANGLCLSSERASLPAARRRPGRGTPGRVTLELPWPWGGEHWVLTGLGPLNFITGPLGSGKTQLATCLARAIPGGSFVGLERLDDGASAAHHRLTADAHLAARVEHAMSMLVADGAASCPALRALLVALHSTRRGVVVVDMIEQDLDDATQRAVMRHLRRRDGVPLVLMTRSTSILDLAEASESDVIIYCPANHSIPMQVMPRQGGSGIEVVNTCLASPAVRARTADVIACRRADLRERPTVPGAGPADV